MVILMVQNKLLLDQMQDQELANEVARSLSNKGQTLATAESCTGGAIGALLTSLAGSSTWFNGGIISYSNSSKINLLSVESKVIDSNGAVSQEVVEAMAIGGRKALAADVCVAVSGVAGPSGGSVEKPVGSVWIAWCGPGIDMSMRVSSQLYHLDGSRKEIQSIAVRMALMGIINRC